MASTDQQRDRERLIEMLERELAAAKAREQTVLDHATSVIRLFEQANNRLASLERHMQELDQRLQQIPQRREEEASHALPAPPMMLHGKSRGPLRYTILDLLQGHPEGLDRKQIETAVGATKRLSALISHMKRDGLIVSKTIGVYVLPPPSDATHTQATA